MSDREMVILKKLEELKGDEYEQFYEEHKEFITLHSILEILEEEDEFSITGDDYVIELDDQAKEELAQLLSSYRDRVLQCITSLT